MTTGTPARPAETTTARRSPWTSLAADEPPGRWTWQADCTTADPELFFPATGDQADEAKRICASCPVKPECLEYSLATAQEFGIWGGLTEQERQALLRRERRRRPGRPS
jgi:WhiB family transcriptional regulator, redox-sensing transcriptional regulator